MLAQARSVLSRARSRAYFPLFARFDAMERSVNELQARIDRLTEQQREFAQLLGDIHLEAVRQQGRLGALEEATSTALAARLVDDERLREIGRSLP